MKINILTKRAFKEASQKAILLAGMIATTLGTTVSVLAADDTLFSTMNANNQTVLDEVVRFANMTILPWVILGYFLALGFAGTNEKAVSALKSSAKVIVIAFGSLNAINKIADFIIWIANTFVGAA